MSIRRKLSTIVLSAALATGVLGIAQDINAARNPNLAEAQRLCEQASQRITMAQQAHHDEMGGHAQKAKEFLSQASHELGLAAAAADARRR